MTEIQNKENQNNEETNNPSNSNSQNAHSEFINEAESMKEKISEILNDAESQYNDLTIKVNECKELIDNCTYINEANGFLERITTLYEQCSTKESEIMKCHDEMQSHYKSIIGYNDENVKHILGTNEEIIILLNDYKLKYDEINKKGN